MVNGTLYSILPLYSFLGVLSIEKGKNGFQNSRFYAISNVLKMFFLLVLTFFLIRSPHMRDIIFQDELLRNNYTSKLLGFTYIVISQIAQWTSIYICLVHFLKQERIKNFLNCVNEFELDEKLKKKLNLI